MEFNGYRMALIHTIQFHSKVNIYDFYTYTNFETDIKTEEIFSIIKHDNCILNVT